jgi:hypothetical protein
MHSGIFLAGMRRTTKNLSQVILSPGRDLNPSAPEYEAGMLKHSAMTFGTKVSLYDFVEGLSDKLVEFRFVSLFVCVICS